MYSSQIKKIGSVLLFLAIFIGSLSIIEHAHVTKAQSPTGAISGFAWSDNIGWISFANFPGEKYGVVYGVQKLNDNTLSGYGWSDNIGWIKFDPSFTGPNANSSGAKIIGTNVTGWARACAGSDDGKCGSVSRTDGWDGWINFSGTTADGGTYATTFPNNKDFKDWSWGSDVVGWIDSCPDSLCVSTDTAVSTQVNVSLQTRVNGAPSYNGDGVSMTITTAQATSPGIDVQWASNSSDSGYLCTSAKITNSNNSDVSLTNISGDFKNGSVTGFKTSSTPGLTKGDNTFTYKCQDTNGRPYARALVVTVVDVIAPPPPPPPTGSCPLAPNNALQCPVSNSGSSNNLRATKSDCVATGAGASCQYYCNTALGYKLSGNTCTKTPKFKEI